MTTYAIEFVSSVKKDLRKLERKDQTRILATIRKLSDDPRPAASKSLKGTKERRLRVGNFRVIYDIYEDKLVVLVIKIAHRREVYR